MPVVTMGSEIKPIAGDFKIHSSFCQRRVVQDVISYPTGWLFIVRVDSNPSNNNCRRYWDLNRVK